MTVSSTRSRGFSLTELLVAMVIGLFLLAGLVALMVNSKKSYTQQDYNARLQENARFAMQFLSYDIRMAGFYGCSGSIINDSSVVAIDATEGGSGASDTVTITYGEPYDAGNEVILDTNYAPYASPLTLTLTSVPEDWSDGDTLVITDCGSGSVADIASGGINLANDQVTVTGSLGRIYDPVNGTGGQITVRRLVTSTYTVQTGASGIPVLSRNGLELVEGVENLQLLFQGLAGGAFVDGTSEPANLAAVQLAALVRSVSNENLADREFGSGADITEDDGQHTMLGTNVSAGTIRGQRRVFSSTLAVRNKPL